MKYQRVVYQSGNRRCLFTLGTKTKEVLNPLPISEMFELDFSVRLTGTCTLSQEDKTLFKRLQKVSTSEAADITKC